MVKFTGDQVYLFCGFFRKRIPEILKNNFFPVTDKWIYQVIDPVRKNIQQSEGNDPEEEDKCPKEEVSQEVHGAKLIIFRLRSSVFGSGCWMLDVCVSVCHFFTL